MLLRVGLERQLLLRFVLVAVISLVIEIAAYVNSARAVESGKRVTEAHLAIARLDQVASMVMDSEAGARGYLLTGASGPLRLFNAAAGSLRSELGRLNEVSAPAGQEAREVRLGTLVGARVSALRRATELKRNGRDAEATMLVQTRDGQREIDEIRALILGLRGAAEGVLMGRELRADIVAQVMGLLSWTGLVTNICVLGLSYRLVTRELRKRREAERSLTELVNIDPLTGLHNRRGVAEVLKIAYARVQRHGGWLSVVMIDIDHFKDYNDTFGHPAGDELLSSTGSMLRSLVRVDDYVGRYGGEEFIVLLPDTDPAMACAVAERIRAGIEAWDRGRSQLTVSLGAATLTSCTSSIDNLIEQADHALYRAKHEGRNRVSHFDGTELAAEPISKRYGPAALCPS